MKSQSAVFKWVGVTVLLFMFFGSVAVSPSVYAQEENPPSATETPTEISTEEFTLPTVTPAPTVEESFMQLQSEEQPFALLQSLEENENRLNPEWPVFNISDSEIVSADSSIATDLTGKIHVVWVEWETNGPEDVYYSFWDGDKLSTSINISASPASRSTTPQLITDSFGRAHIVWEEWEADDVDIMYSRCEEENNNITCSTPVNLSGPPDRHCGGYPYTGSDLRSEAPVIGIDRSNNLMVVWRAYDWGFQITQTYSIWPASGTPPSLPTGCAPFGGSLSQPYRLVEAHKVMGGVPGDFRLVFVSRLSGSVVAQVYYTQFTNGSWSSPVLITDIPDPYPDIFLDETGQAHVSICSAVGILQYWNSDSQILEGIPQATCTYDAPIVVDSTGLLRILWEQNGQIVMSEHAPDGWSEPVKVNESSGIASRPDAVVDANGYTHTVWQDSRNGNWEVHYSFSYSCERIQPATKAGQEVLSVLRTDHVPSLNYCKNQVEGSIRVPAPGGQDDDNEAFKQWSKLASSAKNEVAFTVMFWDKDDDLEDEEGNPIPYPGEIVLQGVQQLYTDFKNPANINDYSRGMTVRILIGVQFNTISAHPGTDQRFSVLKELQELQIPIYDNTLSNGRVWKVEVGLYEYGRGSGLSPGAHSHVKLMIVDNNEMIVSGYHPQYNFGTVENKDHDLGLKVSGPIAANGMAVFDSLWEGSEILCTQEDALDFDSLSLEDCHTQRGENPAHWLFSLAGNDIVLPFYRDTNHKTADKAVEAAIKSADTEVYVFQNRVGVPPLLPGMPSVPQYQETGLLEYASALLSASDKAKIHMIVSQDFFNYLYNDPSMMNFLTYYSIESSGSQSSADLIGFFNPNGAGDVPGLHAKAFLVDREFLVIGSQNFDHSAFGNNDSDLDLVEYSLGIEGGVVGDTVSVMTTYILDQWIKAGKPWYVTNGMPVEPIIQQANAGDVILIDPGVYEVSGTLNIPEGVTLFGTGVTIVPTSNFASASSLPRLASPALQTTPAPLLRITGSNVSIIGLTLKDSSGYGIEIGDSNSQFQNISITNVVFENNILGGIRVQGPTDGDAVSYVIQNNTFIGDEYGITISANANSTGVIRNNIFAGQNTAPIHVSSANDGTVEYSYNLFYDCANNCTTGWISGNLGSESSEHGNLFNSNPLFVDSANDNYQLSANSPALDAGDPSILNEMLFDGDGDGQLRIDLGAFEYYGDFTSATVQSITRTSANPTSASSVDFTVTFSESVTGVDASDFVLTTTDISGAAITAVSGADSAYTVEVDTGTGDGTVRLDVSDSANISDLAGNPLTSLPYVDGETYAINKTVTPTPTGTSVPSTPTSTGTPAPQFVVDEFDGPELASGWEWYLPQDGPTYSLTASPGSLRINLPAERSFEHWGQDDSAPQLRRTDMGNQDWTIETRLNTVNAAPNAGYWAALEVGFDQYDQLWYGMVDDGYLKEVRVGNCCSSFEFYENLPISLRLEKHGENYTYFFKHDADANWTELTTQTYPGTPTYVGLIGRSWNTGSSDLEMDWSYFRIERTQTPDVEPRDVVVSVLNTSGDPQEGLNTYVFDNATYTRLHGVTDKNGQVTFTLPQGSYRFRTDLNGTHFWSGTDNHCDILNCQSASITVTKPVIVNILDTDDSPQAGLKVYAFNGTTYSGYNATTNASGQVTFTLPQGSYRFRADLNGTHFWSGSTNHCDIPDCGIADITVTKPVVVTVLDADESPQAGLKVYAYNGTTYTSYSATTNVNGQVTLTLPQGSYRFRADLNGTQFWSGSTNHCDIPDCGSADITVTKPIVVTVLDTDESPQAGLKVYAYNGTTYTGYSATTSVDGEVTFTLPQGSYRFRADLNGTQFWSGSTDHCDIPDCSGADITVTKPIVVTVLDTDDLPQAGLKVYAFNGTAYTGYNATTNANGQVTLILPLGNYRFRADLNGTQFWSGTADHCDIPGCESASITVTKPIIVTVRDTNDALQTGLKVYAFNGATYTGYNATTNANGQVTLTLPLGDYHFRADLNGTQFWSGASNHCTLPGCESASVTVTNGVLVTVQDTYGTPQVGLKVYVFNGTTYTGYNTTTNTNGQVTLTLPQGSYRFRADLNGTQFWSGSANHCDIPGCGNVNITVTKSISVTVRDTNDALKSGLKVYAFKGTAYTGYNATTNASGQVTLTLPLGNYRFRADLNGTQFWSGTADHCDIPGCESTSITVTEPISVIVRDTNDEPQNGLKVYAFNGTTYTGYNATTNANGQVTLTLPLGNYRFRADLNGTQFWSGASNHCTLPGCKSAQVTVTIPVTVTVQNGLGVAKSGLTVYAFNGTTYTGYSKFTNANGQVAFTLPLGNYRFRADDSNTQFWSSATNQCALPGCLTALVTVTP